MFLLYIFSEQKLGLSMNEKRLEQAADWIDSIHELNENKYEQLILWLDNQKNKKAFERIAQVFSDPAVKYALNKHSTYS